jgi:hypothetical protein
LLIELPRRLHPAATLSFSIIAVLSAMPPCSRRLRIPDCVGDLRGA